MNTTEILEDLASHFPPSKYLGTVPHDGSQRLKVLGNDELLFKIDGCYLYNDNGKTTALWDYRKVVHKRKKIKETSCYIWGAAQLKESLPVPMFDDYFLETFVDGESKLKTLNKMFKNKPHNFIFRMGIEGNKELLWETEDVSENIVESRKKIIEGKRKAPLSVHNNCFATVVLDLNDTSLIINRMEDTDEFAFSLLDSVLTLHTLSWSKQLKKEKRHFSGRSVVNALTYFDKLFETIPSANERTTPLTTREIRKRAKLEKKLAQDRQKAEEVRRSKLSENELMKENYERLHSIPLCSSYLASGSTRIKSFIADPADSFIPSHSEKLDWLPSKVLRHVLQLNGLTTIKLYPQACEVIKETTQAIYTYWISSRDSPS